MTDEWLDQENPDRDSKAFVHLVKFQSSALQASRNKIYMGPSEGYILQGLFEILT